MWFSEGHVARDIVVTPYYKISHIGIPILYSNVLFLLMHFNCYPDELILLQLFKGKSESFAPHPSYTHTHYELHAGDS